MGETHPCTIGGLLSLFWGFVLLFFDPKIKKNVPCQISPQFGSFQWCKGGGLVQGNEPHCDEIFNGKLLFIFKSKNNNTNPRKGTLSAEPLAPPDRVPRLPSKPMLSLFWRSCLIMFDDCWQLLVDLSVFLKGFVDCS